MRVPSLEYYSNTYRKDLSWLHFDDEPRVQERQQVKDKQSYISVSVLYIHFCSTVLHILHFLQFPKYEKSDSHMRYACQIWGQSYSKTVDMTQSTQNKALRIINFKQSMEPSEPLSISKTQNK